MVGWLKDLISPIRRDDPQLGRLRYCRDSQAWEGHAFFRPVDRQVEVLLSGTPNGPTDSQRDLLRKVEGCYAGLWPAVKAKLLEAAAASAVEIIPQDFTLVALDLASGTNEQAPWQLCYESESAFFAVEMRGWNPAGVSVEC